MILRSPIRFWDRPSPDVGFFGNRGRMEFLGIPGDTAAGRRRVNVNGGKAAVVALRRIRLRRRWLSAKRESVFPLPCDAR